MKFQPIIELISRIAFACASLVLMAMSFALVIYGIIEIVSTGFSSGKDIGSAMLSGIGYVVIALAVFDVAKYFVEEEVIRGREMRSVAEARRSLTKFVSTIAIAVFIEGLVIVFEASKQQLPNMIYPTALLLTAILIVVGLGVFQFLSTSIEDKAATDDSKRDKGKGKAV